MEENKHKKSKALIITIICIILLLIFGYLIYKNRDVFGVKTSATIAKIFSPLIPSDNSKNLNKIDQNSKKILVQALEDVEKGKNVSVFGTGANNMPLVRETSGNDIAYGSANQDIANGDIGEVTINSGGSNTFWDSFSNFLGNLFNTNKEVTQPPGGINGSGNTNSCTNGTNNPPLCTTNNNVCVNGATNPPACTTGSDNSCVNGANNPPTCTTTNGTCINGATNPPNCSTLPGSACVNGANNPPLCTTNNGVCVNGAINPPSCTIGTGNICVNGTNNPPLCTTANGVCINGATNPPACTTGSDNSCVNGATNPPDCTTLSNGTCVNGANNPDLCTLYNDGDNGLPDLIAGNVFPTSTTINMQTTLSSNITNIGNGGTGSNFSSYFTIINVSTEETIEKIVNTPPLGASANIWGSATTLHTFSTIGEYYIRVCSDKSSSSDTGTIAESDEDNNCGLWTTLTVTNSIPTEGDICTNGADNPTLCTTTGGLCVNGANNPPTCNTNVCANSATNPPDCTIMPLSETNACLDIEKNPLTFTDAEKAKLAELLRKFYLIAPTLKTSDDISLTYSEITQQKNFSDQLTGLINECYNQGVNRNGNVNPNYTGPTARYGNPWYLYDERGSYIDIGSNNNQPTAACYGTVVKGGPINGAACSIIQGPGACEWMPTSGGAPTGTGCYWMDEMEYERILNIW